MGGFDASVKDVDTSTIASTVIVAVGGASLLAVGDAAETPGRALLLNDGVCGHHGVLLDEVNLINGKLAFVIIITSDETKKHLHLGGYGGFEAPP